MPWPPPFSESELRDALAEATCWADALRSLGYATKGANYRTVQRWSQRWGIPVDHLDSNRGRRRASQARAVPLAQVMIENSSYHRGNLKERLFAEGLKQRVCEMCGQGEEWQGRRMALVLDHINGVSNDHRMENLQIVCPNCAATLDTHCGRNLPRERICPVCARAFPPRHIRHRYCSQDCWAAVAGEAVRGVPQPARRKVERPPYEQLAAEIAALGFSAVGRHYGVSGNAVRKWVRYYQAQHEPQPRAEAPD